MCSHRIYSFLISGAGDIHRAVWAGTGLGGEMETVGGRGEGEEGKGKEKEGGERGKVDQERKIEEE